MDTQDLLQKVKSPFQRYLDMEATGGLLLLVCAILSLGIANSGLGHSYHELLEMDVIFGAGEFMLEKPLHIWINDGLMAIFFFYVGLEIKREIMVGELSDFSQAVFPFFAAIGGMVLPAAIFLVLHGGQAGTEGWGIPMATDIAFSLGILMLLGDRVPIALKVFLTAFAIIDDIGAILVIALFYSSGLKWTALMIAGLLYVLLILGNLLSIRQTAFYFIIGIVIWYFVLQSGVHPTVAGILVALVIPSNNKMRMADFIENTRSNLRHFVHAKANANRQFLAKGQLQAISEIEDDTDKVIPPLQQLENTLHPYVSFFIMPVFALANAGVDVTGRQGGILFTDLSLHIILGLVFGKTLGIMFFSWLSVRLGIANLPSGTTWFQLLGIAFLGGIGFTMSLFISNLAFSNQPDLITPAKLGILIGSALAGVAGLIILRIAFNSSEQQQEAPVIETSQLARNQ